MTNRNAPGSPGEMLAASEAFAASLRVLNDAIDEQSRAIAALAQDLMSAMIALIGQADAIGDTDAAELADDDDDDEELEEAAELVQALTAAMNSPGPPLTEPDAAAGGGDGGDAFSHHATAALETAYDNTVAAQQQLFVTGQAALAQGIASLYKVVVAATGKVEAEELKILLEALGAPQPIE